MTRRRVSDIIQREVEVLSRSGQVVAVAMDSGNEIFRATGKTEKEALNGLLRINWKRVCREVWDKQKGCCLFCERFVPLEFDHIVTRAQQRRDTVENVRGLCTRDHRIRHGDRVR